jgi:type IV secretion system protein VirB5
MKRRLLATVAAALIGSGSAHADLPVIDMTAIQNLITQINWLKQQYTELMSVYNTLAHPTGVLGMAPELFGLQNPLPSLGSITGIISGTDGTSALSGIINQIEQQNQAYRPDGDDWTAQWINRSAGSNAGVQALAETMLQSLQQRISGLDDLETQLGNAQDVTEVDAIGARLQTEQNFVSTQQTEASLLQTLAMTQAQAEQQQVEQRQRQDDDQFYNDTQALP